MPQPRLSSDTWTERSRELRELLARAGLGDRNAFALLYRHTSAHLFGVVLRIQNDRAAAEDVLQDVYVNVWKAAVSFDAAQSQPLTWLTSIARNRAIDSLRRAQARPATVSLTRDEDEDSGDGGKGLSLQERLPDPAPSPTELLAQASDARQLSQCLQALSAGQRQSVALAFFDGLSHAEVAEHLQQPLGTVKSWVRRALMTLRSCLERAVQSGGVSMREAPATGGRAGAAHRGKA